MHHILTYLKWNEYISDEKVCTMKLKFTKSSVIIIGIVALFLLMTGLYFWNFHSSVLSDDKSEWGTFGDYISGVIALLNIVLFVYITKYISDSETKARKHEMRAQANLILTQIRYDEYNKLEKMLNDLVVFGADDGKISGKVRSQDFQIAGIALSLFVRQRKQLFPILNSPDTLEIYTELRTNIKELGKLVNTSDNMFIEEYSNEINTLIKDYIKNQLAFSGVLQEFIFSEIEMNAQKDMK